MGTPLPLQRTRYIGPNHWVLGFAAGWCLFFGVNEIWGRLSIEVDGTVLSSVTTAGNRPVTTYTLRGRDGAETLYAAGATDASLPRRLPNGTRIEKHRLELSWARNGETVNDFSLKFYLGACALGIALALWAFLQWRLHRAHA